MITPFFSPNIGGVETHLDDLCEYLRKRGHQVFVVTYRPLTTRTKAPRFERKRNLEIHRINWFGYNLFHRLELYPLLEFVYLTPMLLLYSLSFLAKRRNEVDVIHAHGINAAFVTKALAGLFRKKAVVSIHAIYDLPKRPMLARLMKLTLFSFDVVLTLAIRSKMELIGIGIDRQKISVFTYWVDQGIFKPLDKMECKEKLGVEERFVVLFVGRLLEIKGVEVLIQAAKRLYNTRDILFIFVGDGPLEGEVKMASNDNENIIYAGRVGNKELSIYYNCADVVVVPSLYEEGFGRVILEALSCGTPVIASNKGGIPEALDDSVGILLEPKADEISHTIESLYKHTEKLENLRRNCRVYAEKRFGELNAKAIEEAYWR